MKKFLAVLLLSWCAVAACGESVPGLGTASFPTTTHSKEAQAQFLRGLLLLHVFEYADAAEAFRAAQKLDPGFAMAYWGEAMTYDHPVWNQEDVAAGQAALAKFAATPEARAAKVSDAKERAYLGAVEILYSGKGSKVERDTAYANAMERMSRTYAGDDEVQLFYALSLLGKSEGVRDVPVYLKAAEISKAVFRRNPQHPGAAHYWIHGMDDPQHAAGALEAARALSKIAPDAGHAQHMCSHIFMALGMWDEVIESNRAGMRVVDDHARAKGSPVIDCGHYAIWLEYAYYQEGRIREGDQTLAECKRTSDEATAQAAKKGAPAQGGRFGLVEMRGIAMVEPRQWAGTAAAMKLEPGVKAPDMAGLNAFVSGYAAAERGDAGGAQTGLTELHKVLDETKGNAEQDSAELHVLAQMLEARIAAKTGDKTGAIAKMRTAAATWDALPFDFGPPATVKPPDELLGELLLEDGKPAEAKTAFAASLKSAPRRALSLLGLARAEAAMGDRAGAKASYGELLRVWEKADAGYGLKAEAEKGGK